ncbi:uncharacterized protein IL334_005217 [Kwoniella shivajii]|uniref:N-acetyltransferase domain-containing protein n=1 Tax=Kwoniella shivajii TaxID=564305 RepID=A0ABZ1D5I8_9TREE|nr:hypothetical protein IL334_005217 [Kwoniella shivajii]
MTTSTMKANLADFTIRIANHDQEIQHAKAGYVHWKKDSTFEQFWQTYRRERDASPWSTGKRLVTWALVRRDDPDGELYAGCETYLRKGLVKHVDSDQVEDTYIYGIASVVTPDKHYRNGYATRLLSLLHHRLSSLPTPSSYSGDIDALPIPSDIPLPEAIGSILWSDIGSTFYSRCSSSSERQGWVVEDSLNMELYWKLFPPQFQEEAKELDKGWKWIYLNDLPDISEKLSVSAKKRLEDIDTSEKAVFMNNPSSEGTLDFVPLKGIWQRSLISDPEPVGLRYVPSEGGSENKEETIILFSGKMINIGDKLLITYIENFVPSQMEAVLKALDIIGHKAGQSQGWIWDISPSSELVKAWQGLEGREVQIGRKKEIDGHLLGVAWYGDLQEKGKMIDGQMWSWC